MKTQIKIISSVLLFMLSASLFSPFLFLFNKKTAYYAYKEVTYRVIINNIIQGKNDPREIVDLFLEYFHNYLFTPAEAMPVDRDVYNDLIRGIAWCDQRSWGLGTFLGKMGIGNRMLMTRNHEGISNHTLIEVLICGKWGLFDPMFGFVFKDDNSLVSYEDVCRNPSLFYLNPNMVKLKDINPEKYDYIKEYFTKNIFYENALKPVIWQDPVSSKDFLRKIITGTLDFYISIFGKHFSYLYQDVYLSFFSPSAESDRVYFKARNYDLYSRDDLAASLYRQVIDSFPESQNCKDALFFLGKLYNRTNKANLSIDTLQALLERYPNTKWRRIATYFLGYDYELLKDFKLAKDYYWEAEKMYGGSGAGGIQPGEFKVVRRLHSLLDKQRMPQ